MIRSSAVLFLAWSVAVTAAPLEFPSNATKVSETVTPLGSHALPTGPWSEEGIPTIPTEGQITRQAWQIDAGGLTTLQLLRPLRGQLQESGYEVLFECETDACGGFDFRFGTEVIGAPEMHVDLGNFRFMSARLGDTYISLLVSRTSRIGYVQVTRIGPPTSDTPVSTTTGQAVRGAAFAGDGDIGSDLESLGRVILADLAFASGSAQLTEGEYSSLGALADYLRQNPDRRVALVGHTDAVGSLEGNIALSKRRAGSVLERLVAEHSVDRGQLEAEGMGYLAPVASNLSADGREENRRVEAILLSTD